jgi:hypothetical protein
MHPPMRSSGGCNQGKYMTKPQIEYISVKEAAQLGTFNEEYVRQLLRAGTLQGKKFAGTWMVDKATLLAYLKSDRTRKPQVDRAL